VLACYPSCLVFFLETRAELVPKDRPSYVRDCDYELGWVRQISKIKQHQHNTFYSANILTRSNTSNIQQQEQIYMVFFIPNFL